MTRLDDPHHLLVGQRAESKLYDGRAINFIAAEKPSRYLQSFEPLTLTNGGLVSGEGWTGLGELKHLRRYVLQSTNDSQQPIGQPMATPGAIFGANNLSFTETWRNCHS